MGVDKCYGSQGCCRKLFKVIRQIRLELPKGFFKAGLHFIGGYPMFLGGG